MELKCRSGCGACCIALSISSPLPGFPLGKPAGMPCPYLAPDYRCKLWGSPDRPDVCANLRPEPEMCGNDRQEALKYLRMLEEVTKP